MSTKKDFNDFKKWCRFYMKEWGLNDWTVHFLFKEIDALALARVNMVARVVTFVLNTHPDFDKIDNPIKRMAKHECIHVLIASLSHQAGVFTTKEEWEKEEEALVCRLTNLLSN